MDVPQLQLLKLATREKPDEAQLGEAQPAEAQHEGVRPDVVLPMYKESFTRAFAQVLGTKQS